MNTNPDLVDLLKVRIGAAGFVVLELHIADIRAGVDVGAMLWQHDPQVIVYDVVSPFERNWKFLSHLRETVFKDRRFVLTSPNAGALSRLAGRDEKVCAVIDDGGDVDAIVQAVREAVRARPTR